MALLPSPFTAAERELIGSEFMVRFGQAPRVADGIGLRTWRGGPQSGQPKLSQAVASLFERGFVQVEPSRLGPCARFTPAGLRNSLFGDQGYLR